jgi:hypothetical protein
MEKTLAPDKTPRLNILRSGDPNTSFGHLSPAEILDRFGPPKFLLSTKRQGTCCFRETLWPSTFGSPAAARQPPAATRSSRPSKIRPQRSRRKCGKISPPWARWSYR